MRVENIGLSWYTFAYPHENIVVRWSENYIRMPYNTAVSINENVDGFIKTFSDKVEGDFFIEQSFDNTIRQIVAFEKLNDFIMFKLLLDYDHNNDKNYDIIDEFAKNYIFKKLINGNFAKFNISKIIPTNYGY